MRCADGRHSPNIAQLQRSLRLWPFLHESLCNPVDDSLIAMSVTFSTAYGVYLLGEALHTSGLLAVVAAGLVIGSSGRRTGRSEHTQEAVHAVWEFIGYLANSLLFLLLGIEIGASNLPQSFLPGIVWALAGVVAGRVVMVYTCVPLHQALARRWARRENATRRFLPVPRPLPTSWRPLIVLSGLRG